MKCPDCMKLLVTYTRTKTTLLGTITYHHIPSKMTHFEDDDVPVSKVGYVSPPEGNMEPQNEGFLFKGAEVAPESRPFCPTQIHLSNERRLVVDGFLGDEKLPSYVGIMK